MPYDADGMRHLDACAPLDLSLLKAALSLEGSRFVADMRAAFRGGTSSIVKTIIQEVFWKLLEDKFGQDGELLKASVLCHILEFLPDETWAQPEEITAMILISAIQSRAGLMIVKLLVQRAPSCLIYVSQESEKIPAHCALIQDAPLDIIRVLTQATTCGENTINIASMTDLYGFTTLHYAAFYLHPMSVVEYLHDLFPEAADYHSFNCSDQSPSLSMPKSNYHSTPLCLALDYNMGQGRAVGGRLSDRNRATRHDNTRQIVFLLHHSPHMRLIPDSTGDIAFHKLIKGHYPAEIFQRLLQQFWMAHTEEGFAAALVKDGEGCILLEAALKYNLSPPCVAVICQFMKRQLPCLMYRTQRILMPGDESIGDHQIQDPCGVRICTDDDGYVKQYLPIVSRRWKAQLGFFPKLNRKGRIPVFFTQQSFTEAQGIDAKKCFVDVAEWISIAKSPLADNVMKALQEAVRVWVPLYAKRSGRAKRTTLAPNITPSLAECLAYLNDDATAHNAQCLPHTLSVQEKEDILAKELAESERHASELLAEEEKDTQPAKSKTRARKKKGAARADSSISGQVREEDQAGSPWPARAEMEEHAHAMRDVQEIQAMNSLQELRMLEFQGLQLDDQCSPAAALSEQAPLSEHGGNWNINPLFLSIVAGHQGQAKSTKTPSVVELLSKIEDLEQRFLCVSCLDQARDVVFIPCRHLCYCKECLKTYGLPHECPLCRTVPESALIVFV